MQHVREVYYPDSRRHEQTEKFLRVFANTVGNLFKLAKDIGNNFQEEAANLLTLNTN